jgi:putative ABC transport system substrate-binding protein
MCVIALFLVGIELCCSGVSRAERARPIRIGALTESWGPTPGMVGLRDSLQKLGYREDEDFFLGVRFTQGNLAELSAAAQELVQHGVDLILTVGVNATQAAQRATQTIPIVFMNVDDPVVFGLVQSYARPGGNLTGVTDLAFQLGPKRLELFREMIPDLQRVLFPYDVTDSVAVKQFQIYREAAHHLGIELVELTLCTQAEAQEMLSRSPDKTVQGILAPRDVSLNIPGFVLQATSERTIPTMFPQAFYVERGGSRVTDPTSTNPASWPRAWWIRF